MTLDRYGEITGTDPVMVHARQNYYDPICHDWFLMGGITFEAYLDQYRSRFGQA